MPNPGNFHGKRLEFLTAQKPCYIEAYSNDHGNDCIADIQRRYFKRFPIDLDESVEPSPEALAAVDDDEADPEPPAPDEEKMTPEEFAAAVKAFDERQLKVKEMRTRITRWFVYRRPKPPSNTDTPMASLTAPLLSAPAKKKRQPIAFNLWAKAHPKEVENAYRRRCLIEQPPKGKALSIRSAVAREEFFKLPQEVQEEWQNKAKEEHQAFLAVQEKEPEYPIDHPISRQRAIEGLVGFAQPILDQICLVTGMKASLIVGGPEPAAGGRLSVIGIHSGKTEGSVKLKFGEAERADYKKYILPLYNRFLKKCYTPAECRSRALPDEGPRLADLLADLDALDHGVTVDAADHDPLALDDSSASTSQRSHSPRPSLSIPSGSTRLSRSRAPSRPDPAGSRPSTPTCSPPPSRMHSPLLQSPPLSPALGSTSLPPLDVLASVPSASPSSASPPAPLPSSTDPVPEQLPPLPASLSSTDSDSETPPPPPAPPSPADPVPERSPSPPPGVSARARAADKPLETGGKKRKGQDAGAPPTAKRSKGDGASGSAPLATTQKRKEQDMETPPAAKRRKNGAGGSVLNTPASLPTWESFPALTPGSTSVSAKSTSTPGSASTSTSTSTSTSSTPTSTPAGVPTPPPVPAPAWLVSALKMLRSEDFGVEWRGLVSTWEVFEAEEGYTHSLPLSPKGRPGCISDWIKRARSPNFRPAIASPAKFGEAFAEWWRLLQPAWRRPDPNGPLFRGPCDKTPEDLVDVRKPGANGLLSVMAALFFWGCALGRSDRTAWLAAVEEVLWVLQQFLL